jgi:hypothetical protein
MTPLALLCPLLALAAATESPSGGSVAPGGRRVGIGLEIGAPTNLNAKFMLGLNHGIVVGVGAGIWYDASLSLHSDYLFHPLVMNFDDVSFSGYVGGGLWASVGYPGSHLGYYRPFLPGVQPFAAGARVPLGLNLAFNEVPIEVFFELVPALSLFPGFGVFGQGGLGARFYF